MVRRDSNLACLLRPMHSFILWFTLSPPTSTYFLSLPTLVLLPLTQVLLFGNYVWNATPDGKLPDGVVRVADWQEALRVLDKLDLK